ncbi:MAG: flagellar basal-body rod modification protein FlgD [Myxococcota bacterium]|jgi:flagellar basal-body rod modification protein FlgD
MIDGISSSLGMGAGESASGKGPDELGKDEFLRLLTTQLSQQDPLNPQDGTEFVSQLAEFTSLERLVNLEQGLDNVAAASLASNSTLAASLIGKSVRVEGNDFAIGKESSGQLAFEFDKDPSTVKIEILDSEGNVVDTRDTGGSIGLNTYHHNGMTGGEDSPSRLPPGQYSYRITATDEKGEPVTATSYTMQEIMAVNFKDFTPMLVLANGAEKALGEVVEVLGGDATTPRTDTEEEEP